MKAIVLLLILALQLSNAFSADTIDLAKNIDEKNTQALRLNLAKYDGNFYLESEYSLLQLAIAKEAIDIIDLLIEAGADVNGTTKGFRKKSHLHLAVEIGNVEIAQRLIELGANVEQGDKLKQSPLIYAMSRNNIEMMDLLFKLGAGAEADQDGGERLLLYSMANIRSPTVVQRLLQEGLKINTDGIVNNLCVKCHNATGPTPWGKAVNITGQNSKYIRKQLMDFKAGDRVFELMQKFVQTLSQSMIDELSEYYAKQDPASPFSMTDFGNVGNGKSMYTEGVPANGVPPCISCHLDGEVPIDSSIPRLRGMNANYIYKELLNFKTGERSNDRDRLMRSASESLEDPQMRDLAAYLSTI